MSECETMVCQTETQENNVPKGAKEDCKKVTTKVGLFVFCFLCARVWDYCGVSVC